jgi:hypothetical protein
MDPMVFLGPFSWKLNVLATQLWVLHGTALEMNHSLHDFQSPKC